MIIGIFDNEFDVSCSGINSVFKQFLDDVPIAAFAALAAPGVLAGGDENIPRTVAALVAAAFVWKFRTLWVCILTGFIAYWLTRLAMGL